MSENLITSFAEFRTLVNESNEATNEALLVGKRKHGDSPATFISTNAPVRTKVLGFIAEKGTVTKTELMEYFSMLEEDLGKKPSWGWLRKNSHLIDSDLDENGDTNYTLTKRGKRVLEVYKNYETLNKKSKEIENVEEIETT